MLVIQNRVVSVKPKDSPKPGSVDQLKRMPRGRPIPEKDQVQRVSRGRPGGESGDRPEQASRSKPIPEKARAARNTKGARGNRRIRPMPQQQGRAIADAILIFLKP